jgi:hypothetical protein
MLEAREIVMDAKTSARSVAASKREEDHRRRELMRHIPRRCELEHLVGESTGYAWLSAGPFSGVPAAVRFAHQALEERRLEAKTELHSFRGADLLAATRYEDAPRFFDLALSDEILQLACDYMGEIPILLKPRLWWTKPEEPDAKLGGTQLFHIGSRARPPVRRQAKFLFTMSDVDENSGPFTFLPADVSEKIARALRYEMGEEVSDEVIYSYARPTDTMRLVGPPGTGLMVDTCRCFHFGRRASSNERLMLMIQFKRPADGPEHDRVERSAAFLEKFGDDSVRKLVIPAW